MLRNKSSKTPGLYSAASTWKNGEKLRKETQNLIKELTDNRKTAPIRVEPKNRRFESQGCGLKIWMVAEKERRREGEVVENSLVPRDSFVEPQP